MTITIPVWLIATVGVIAGVLLIILAAIGAYAIVSLWGWKWK